MVIIFSAGVFIFSPQILFVLIGHEHAHSAFLLRMFMIAVVLVSLNIPPYLILLADNHKKSYLRVFTFGTILNLISNIILAYYFQATGTVIATIITEFVITAALYWETYRMYWATQNKNITAVKLLNENK
jgi:O-antigen/teichoic acid export membrane protein